jgi:hypothetical protein
MTPWPPLRGVIDRIGLAGCAGVICLAAGVSLQTTLGRRLASQRDELQLQATALRETLRAAGPRDASRDDSATAQLARFYAGFPTAQTTAEWLARIQDAALRNGIDLQAGEYRMETRSGERLRRYLIVLPVRGSYAQIRGFVDAALGAVPSASLDEIDMRRDSALSSTLQARLRMTLYLRAGS